MTTRADIAEMGLLDYFLALCKKKHVLLDALLGGRRSPALHAARVEAYEHLRSEGLGVAEIAAIFNRDASTVSQVLTGTQNERRRNKLRTQLRLLG